MQITAINANPDYTLNRSVLFEHANLSATEFRSRFCIIDGALFCAVASPVRLNAKALVTLPTASDWANLDERCLGNDTVIWLSCAKRSKGGLG